MPPPMPLTSTHGCGPRLAQPLFRLTGVGTLQAPLNPTCRLKPETSHRSCGSRLCHERPSTKDRFKCFDNSLRSVFEKNEFGGDGGRTGYGKAQRLVQERDHVWYDAIQHRVLLAWRSPRRRKNRVGEETRPPPAPSSPLSNTPSSDRSKLRVHQGLAQSRQTPHAPGQPS